MRRAGKSHYTKFILAGLAALSLAGCAETPQGKLKDTLEAAESTYIVVSDPVPDLIAGTNPKLKLSDKTAIVIGKVNKAAQAQFAYANADRKLGKPLTQAEVDQALAALKTFETCWKGVKLDEVTADCAAASGLIVTTTPTGK